MPKLIMDEATMQMLSSMQGGQQLERFGLTLMLPSPQLPLGHGKHQHSSEQRSVPRRG
jgi:hypothetical protein